MHAIDTAGSINGKFSEGNPSTGQRATRVGADWLNDLQANVLKLLSEAGIVPTKGRDVDVLEAIKAIARGVGGGSGSGGGVPSTRKITVGGLLTTSGEDLSQDRKLTVPAASAAEVLAGSDDAKAITPKALFDAYAGALNGKSVQIGPLTFKAGSNLGLYGQRQVYTPFATPFATACWGVMPIVRNDSGGTNRDVWAQLVGAAGKDGFTVMIQDSSAAGDRNCDGFDYVAIGL
ncbi:hypothetical protein [Sphingomonas sp. TX0522]|uniref:hypothetical protein n=1 Tax=Sphingomonas sp. TX0522 TaxID=2479205 RepID=UPI0018DFB0AD|nr:hypothetical protein [Sphingomonas sp. TX0522]MBI0530104.1 hypothetical protein [Sphingomonas sp. TX0522]